MLDWLTIGTPANLAGTGTWVLNPNWSLLGKVGVAVNHSKGSGFSNETDLMLALRTLSKAFGGVQEVARQADVNAHTLYRTLSERGNPELKTLSAILKAMGMRLAIQPLNHHAHA